MNACARSTLCGRTISMYYQRPLSITLPAHGETGRAALKQKYRSQHRAVVRCVDPAALFDMGTGGALFRCAHCVAALADHRFLPGGARREHRSMQAILASCSRMSFLLCIGAGVVALVEALE